MPPRRRGLSEADKALWAEYSRQIAPLHARDAGPAVAAEPQVPPPAPGPSPSSSLPPRPLVAGKPVKARAATPALNVGMQPGGLDSATWQ
ncbi:MAG TPA: hypothetical protein VHO91_13025, partial [Rhodopila sp.]|nr:hypothetical protein [Rhodopila sp.]